MVDKKRLLFMLKSNNIIIDINELDEIMNIYEHCHPLSEEAED